MSETLQEESTAARVLRIRQELGLSQEALAERLGVDRRTVMRWEHGRVVKRVYIDRLDDMLRRKTLEGAVTTGTGFNKEFFPDAQAKEE